MKSFCGVWVFSLPILYFSRLFFADVSVNQICEVAKFWVFLSKYTGLFLLLIIRAPIDIKSSCKLQLNIDTYNSSPKDVSELMFPFHFTLGRFLCYRLGCSTWLSWRCKYVHSPCWKDSQVRHKSQRPSQDHLWGAVSRWRPMCEFDKRRIIQIKLSIT